jgi:hypothetical protein
MARTLRVFSRLCQPGVGGCRPPPPRSGSSLTALRFYNAPRVCHADDVHVM